MDAKERMLRSLELFGGCSQAELRWVYKQGDVVDVRAGTTLVRGGEHAREFCVIVDGFAEATGNGASVTLGPGSYFGHVEIMSDRTHAMAVTAKGDLRVLAFEVRAFRGFADRAPTALRKLFGEVATRVPVGPAVGRRLAVA